MTERERLANLLRKARDAWHSHHPISYPETPADTPYLAMADAVLADRLARQTADAEPAHSPDLARALERMFSKMDAEDKTAFNECIFIARGFRDSHDAMVADLVAEQERPLTMIVEARQALGLSTAARPESPSTVWQETLAAMASTRARVAELEHFIDFTVRAWLTDINEHAGCPTDECKHAAFFADRYDDLNDIIRDSVTKEP